MGIVINIDKIELCTQKDWYNNIIEIMEQGLSDENTILLKMYNNELIAYIVGPDIGICVLTIIYRDALFIQSHFEELIRDQFNLVSILSKAFCGNPEFCDNIGKLIIPITSCIMMPKIKQSMKDLISNNVNSIYLVFSEDYNDVLSGSIELENMLLELYQIEYFHEINDKDIEKICSITDVPFGDMA